MGGEAGPVDVGKIEVTQDNKTRIADDGFKILKDLRIVIKG